MLLNKPNIIEGSKNFSAGSELERNKCKNKNLKEKSHGDIVHGATTRMDGLHDAIANARKTLKQALGDANSK